LIALGFDLPKESKRVPKGAQVVIEAEDYKYALKRANWIYSETDEVLHPYYPKIETLRLMEYTNYLSQILSAQVRQTWTWSISKRL
jgi:hypothetical protein